MTPSCNVSPEEKPPRRYDGFRRSHKQTLALCNTARWRDRSGYLVGPSFPVAFTIHHCTIVPRDLHVAGGTHALR